MRPFGDGHLAACHFPLQTPTGPAAAKSVHGSQPRPDDDDAGGDSALLRRTSNASRKASPMKLKATTTSTIQSPAG